MKRATALVTALAMTLASAVAAQCTPDPLGGPLLASYVTPKGDVGDFITERDCGFAVEVGGEAISGRAERVIWGFCDPVGYSAEGQAWNSLVPSNGYGIGRPEDDPTQVPLVSPVNTYGGALGDHELLIPNAPESCGSEPGLYPREWIHSMVRIPDIDPRFETIAIFYQNFCIDFKGGYEFGPGGVSLAVWDAENPDGRLVRQRISDRWFIPGLLTDYRRFADADVRSFSYGSGAVIVPAGPDSAELYMLMCGGGGDCQVARTTFSTRTFGPPVVEEFGDTSTWRYKTVTGEWIGFPARTEAGTCAPTRLDDCGGFPDPAVVAKADPTNVATLRAGELTTKEVDGTYYMLHAYGFDDGLSVRIAEQPDGPFSDPIRLDNFRPDVCGFRRCRAPIWHEELDRPGEWGVSYYNRTGLNQRLNLPRDAGHIEVATIPALDLMSIDELIDQQPAPPVVPLRFADVRQLCAVDLPVTRYCGSSAEP